VSVALSGKDLFVYKEVARIQPVEIKRELTKIRRACRQADPER
jgi:hypothetical protein